MSENNFEIYIGKIKKSMDTIRKQFGMAREFCGYLNREYDNCKHEGNNQMCKYKDDVYCKLENCPFLK